MSWLAALWLMAAPARASGAGTSVAPILRLGPGARSAGMGDSFVAIAEGADASAWNPGGLAFLDRPVASLMYLRLFNQIHYNYLAFGMPAGDRFGLGAHAIYASTDDIPRTVEDNGGNFDAARSGGSFNGSDLKVALSGAAKLLSWLSAGGSASFWRDSVDASAANGVLFDVAALARPAGPLRFGVAAQNLGAGKGGASPAQLRAGAAAQWSERGLVSAELQRPFDTGARIFAFGTEYWVMPMLALRVGYRLGAADDAGGHAYSVGLGLRVARAAFDLAVVPYGELGVSERFSLSYAFGGPAQPRDLESSVPTLPQPDGLPPGADELIRQADELIAQKRYPQAQQTLGQALNALSSDDERQVRVLERSGFVDYQLNDLRAAKAAYQEALQKGRNLGILPPSVADAYAGMGLVLLKEGRRGYAKKFLEKALEASPSEPTRHQVRAELDQLSVP